MLIDENSKYFNLNEYVYVETRNIRNLHWDLPYNRISNSEEWRKVFKENQLPMRLFFARTLVHWIKVLSMQAPFGLHKNYIPNSMKWKVSSLIPNVFRMDIGHMYASCIEQFIPVMTSIDNRQIPNAAIHHSVQPKFCVHILIEFRRGKNALNQ